MPRGNWPISGSWVDDAMTEQEWLDCTDPKPMLQFLRGKASERKMRLFLVACARLVWDRMTDPVMRMGVETAERFADGLASAEEQQAAHFEIYELAYKGPSLSVKANTMGVTVEEYFSLFGLSLSCGFSKASLDRIERTNAWGKGGKLTAQYQPFLLREIFGNPFRRMPLDPHWLTPRVVSLAHTIYDGGTFDQLTALAEALEEAGCGEPDLLSHCRGLGQHVRGCWVMDLLLGKE
jgi:hypothetical protein